MSRSYKKWTEQEEKALVEFISLHRDLQYDQNSEWPSMKCNSSYWEEASAYISTQCNTTLRNGMTLKIYFIYI